MLLQPASASGSIKSIIARLVDPLLSFTFIGRFLPFVLLTNSLIFSFAVFLSLRIPGVVLAAAVYISGNHAAGHQSSKHRHDKQLFPVRFHECRDHDASTFLADR